MKGKSLMRPTHVITAKGQHFNEKCYIVAGQNNLRDISVFVPRTKQTVTVRREMLMPLNDGNVNAVLIDICDELSVEIGKLHGHTSDAAVAALTAYSKSMNFVQSKFVK